MLMTRENLRHLDQTILEAIAAHGDWIARADLAKAIGRPSTLHPADFAALERLQSLELIETRQAPRGIAGTKWEYRIKQ